MTGNWWWWQVKTISELPRFSATAGNMNPTFSQHGHRGSHRIPGSARTWKKLNDLTWAIFALTFSPGRGVFKKIQWKGHWCSRNPWFLPIAFWENWPAKDDLVPAIYPKAWASFQSLIIVSGNGVSSATYLHVLGFFFAIYAEWDIVGVQSQSLWLQTLFFVSFWLFWTSATLKHPFPGFNHQLGLREKCWENPCRWP